MPDARPAVKDAPGPEWLGRLPVLVLIALVHRTIIVLWTTTIATDSADYLRMAEKLSQGEFRRALELSYHPLFSALTALAQIPLGSFERAGYLVTVLATSLAVVPLFHLVRIWWSERVARWTCLLYALHPTLSEEGSEVMTTGLFISLLIAGAALIAFAPRKGRWPLYPLAGFVAGLCYLTRPEGIYLVLFAAVGVATWLVRWIRRKGSSAEDGAVDGSTRGLIRFLGGLLLASCVYAATAGPYILWIHDYTGRWALSSRGATLAMMDTLMPRKAPPSGPPAAATPAPQPADPKIDRVEPAPTIPPDRSSAPAPISHRGSPPLVVLAKDFKSAFYWPLLPLWVLGVAFCRREGGQWGALLPLAGMAFTCFAPSVLSCFIGSTPRLSHRYLLPGIPFLLAWAAAGFLAAWGWVSRRVGASASPRMASLAWAPHVILVALLLIKSIGPRRGDEWTFVEAGAWLRQQSLPAPRHIMDSSEKTGFYGNCISSVAFPSEAGGGRWIRSQGSWAPSGSPEAAGSVSDCVRRTFDAYRKHELGYLILDEHRLKRYPSGFRQELESVGFERVATFDRGGRSKGITVWVYRLNGAS
jgi:hypothetical protein